MTKNIFIAAFLIFSIKGYNQTLKLEEIMKGESFIGNQPINGRWSLDSKKVYFDWNPTNDLGASTYSWQKGAAKPVLVEPKEAAFSKLDFKRKPGSDLVYYLDNGTPEPILSALLDGARWWNQAFTAAGYKDAFIVKVLPGSITRITMRSGPRACSTSRIARDTCHRRCRADAGHGPAPAECRHSTAMVF